MTDFLHQYYSTSLPIFGKLAAYFLVEKFANYLAVLTKKYRIPVRYHNKPI